MSYFNGLEENLYGLPLLKMLERGLNKEVDSIYEVLRDLMMAREFLDLNTPGINLEPRELVSRQSTYEMCEAWLRQIIALR